MSNRKGLYSNLHPAISPMGAEPIYGSYANEKTVNHIITQYEDGGFMKRRNTSERATDKSKLEALSLMSLGGALTPEFLNAFHGYGMFAEDDSNYIKGQKRYSKSTPVHTDIPQTSVDEMVAPKAPEVAPEGPDFSIEEKQSEVSTITTGDKIQAEYDVAGENVKKKKEALKKVLPPGVGELAGGFIAPPRSIISSDLDNVVADPDERADLRVEGRHAEADRESDKELAVNRRVGQAPSPAPSPPTLGTPTSSTKPEESEQVTKPSKAKSEPIPERKMGRGKSFLPNQVDYRKNHGRKWNSKNHGGVKWHKYRAGKTRDNI